MHDLSAKGYELKEAIGVGGMCEVYKACQTALQRNVAIKVLKSKFTDSKSQCERFILEARNCSRIAHPNIVEIYEVDTFNGRPFIAMELVPGKTLRKLLDEGVKMKMGIEIFVQIAEALVFAHQKGIIHRDLKPSNILINENNEAKVGDWGLSRQLSSTHRVTRTGIILGSPGYMSPEQIQGRELTPSSDLYSLGIMLFELFAGRPPFTQRRMADLVNAHLTDKAPRLDKFAPTTPSEIVNLVAELIGKRPEDRPSGAETVVEVLKRELQGKGKRRRLQTVMCTVSDTANQRAGDKTTVSPRRKLPHKAKAKPQRRNKARFYGLPFLVLIFLFVGFWAFYSDKSSVTERTQKEASLIFERAEIVAIDKIALRFSGEFAGQAAGQLIDGNKGKNTTFELDFSKAKAITKRRKELVITSKTPLFNKVTLKFSGPVPETKIEARRGSRLTKYLEKLGSIRGEKLGRACYRLQTIHGLISRAKKSGNAELLNKNRQAIKTLLAELGLGEENGRALNKTLQPFLVKEPLMNSKLVHWLFPLRALETCLTEADEILSFGRVNDRCGQSFDVFRRKEIPHISGGKLLSRVPKEKLANCWLMTPCNISRSKKGTAILGSLQRGIKLDDYGFNSPSIDGYAPSVSLKLFVEEQIVGEKLVLAFSGYRFCREIAMTVKINDRNSIVMLNTGYFQKERSQWSEIDTWQTFAKISADSFQQGSNTLHISVEDLPGVKSGLGFKLRDVRLYGDES